MDAIISWLNDKKNMPIVIAAAAIILVLFFVFMKMTGKIGGSATKKDGAETTATATGTAPAAGMMPGSPGMSGMPGMMPGAPGMGGTDQTQVAAAPVVKLSPMLPYRKDPFQPLGGQPSKAQRLASMIPSLPHIRLQPVSVEIPESDIQETLPPQPTRRVAGVMWNGQVSALLETNGEMDIVRPGKIIDKGNSKVVVEKIHSDSVILKTLDTKKPMYIRVGLAGSPNAASAANTGANMPGGMMPTMPGGMMPTMPGMMPGIIGQ